MPYEAIEAGNLFFEEVDNNESYALEFGTTDGEFYDDDGADFY
uniref:Uncharacterized protein n=1 Tax=Arundo donax TaxID=35708 RepID=A0A0A9AYN9_ARUDO